MKFTFASWATRGEVEPCAAIGREFLRRGHEVRIAVPPDLVGFAESAGLAAVAYGPNLQAILDAYRDFWTCFFRSPRKIREMNRLWCQVVSPFTQWAEMSTTLMALADGADLLMTSNMSFEALAANVAEYYDIPLATLHFFPLRANGCLLPFLPAPVCRSAMNMYELQAWRGAKKFEDAQRRELGLPKATGPLSRRLTVRGALEIQAYDEACFPRLAAEWAKWTGQRPFVGTLTLELSTDAVEEVMSWIAAGTPPIFFGFGSMPVQAPAETIAMIGAACRQLAERALVCAGCSDFSQVPEFDHVKVVAAANLAATFPACRAVVHHGGAGTTAISLRSGAPTLILSTDFNQMLWGTQVKRLKVGTARRFSTITEQSLIGDLRTILAPQYVARARELATRMSKPAESVTHAADLVENLVRVRRVG